MAILTDITELENVFDTSGLAGTIPINPPVGGWIIDFDDQLKIIYYTTEGLELLLQSIKINLNTERTEWVIYSTDFGQEFKEYLSKADNDFVVSMLPTLITNTLMVDDRITTCVVQNIVRSDFNTITCDIRLNTIFGEVNIDKFEIGV